MGNTSSTGCFFPFSFFRWIFFLRDKLAMKWRLVPEACCFSDHLRGGSTLSPTVSRLSCDIGGAIWSYFPTTWGAFLKPQNLHRVVDDTFTNPVFLWIFFGTFFHNKNPGSSTLQKWSSDLVVWGESGVGWASQTLVRLGMVQKDVRWVVVKTP